MLESVIVLRDALETLPGGFRDTTEVYRHEAAGRPTSIEHYSSAQMFVERALFNRNSLLGCLPEDIFSARLANDRERQLVFRCALAEFGGASFRRNGIDLESFSGERLKQAKKDYGNSPLRLHEKREDKLRDDFCKGWPPIEYDKKTIELINSINSRYKDVFIDENLQRFLKREELEMERYRVMQPGPEAFKKILQTERGQDSVLWGLNLWDIFEDDSELGRPPVVELVGRLGQSFRNAGYHESTVEYFEKTTLASFSEYRDSYYGCSSLWNAKKGAVIYNIVISAFYGPKSAMRNCYSDEIAATQIADCIPRSLNATGPLKRGRGEAVIRQLLPNGVAHVVEVVNLDSLPEKGPRLITIIGREYGGFIKDIDDTEDFVIAASREMAVFENSDNFYPTDYPADSARHLGIYSIDGIVHIADLASSNGTTLVRLDGDTIQLGEGVARDHPYSAEARRGDRLFLGDSEFELI